MERTEEALLLEQDRADIIEILKIRFGNVPRDVVGRLAGIRRGDALQRLILIAANAADWGVFLEELETGEASFKILGDRFDPMSRLSEKG